MGLEINPAKCELFFVGTKEQFCLGIEIIEEVTLLGLPLIDEAISTTFSKKLEDINRLINRLSNMNAHVAYYLLQHYNQWIRVSFPIRNGSIGIRKLSDVALSAFISSVNACFDLVSSITHSRSDLSEDASYKDAMELWHNLNSSVAYDVSSQQNWDLINITRIIENFHFESEVEQNFYKGLCEPESGAWKQKTTANDGQFLVRNTLENHHLKSIEAKNQFREADGADVSVCKQFAEN
ncbi:hypothetical protein ILUMI_19864 [Ignelater luminosus]|uniref:Uncharacterized protein n=1 Tax=Ignelater luminosus TaxID=2038154 RepID=A0A8K0CHE0_IGNLU|nr:hypothetical protein ILUMI_19864 [Ignelater luminosus]